MPRIDTYNLKNASAAQRVTLEDLLGSNYKEKLDADILAQMRKDPDQYFLEEFKGRSRNSRFILKKANWLSSSRNTVSRRDMWVHRSSVSI